MGTKRTLQHVVDASGPHRRDLEARKRILTSALEQLEERGYARMTIEQVAVSARVGKATLYRSWPNKAALVLDAVRSRLREVPTAETGDTRGELLSMAKEALAGFFGSPQVQAVLPALVADTAQDPELRRRLREEVLEPRRARSRTVLERAIGRGDLPEDTDISLALEMWAGAMMFRSVFYGDGYDDAALARLVDATLASPPRFAADGEARPVDAAHDA
ncbi:TetR/AcrR family transcriptional regulator [Streptomyces colonosanans]|uniref:TetR/AcrR family transcriptional regulator n=1 Tax=Streptomyces colonosanans TaxID=1428652 RepID=UPI0009A0A8ED|nr:TetR/AcrR family transcriptional regulator [Streptomyces colonosanans]